MRIAALTFLVLVIRGLAAFAAEPSVAVVETTHAPDPSWREQDLRILESLRSALDARPGLRTLSASQVSAVFKEPSEEASVPLATRASQRLKKGQDYYARLKPKKAIKEFSEALRILRAIFPSLPGLSELEQAHLMLGMTYQALGQARRAAREYGMVLLINPQRKLDEITRWAAKVYPAVLGVGVLGQAGIILSLLWLAIRALGMNRAMENLPRVTITFGLIAWSCRSR